MRAWLVVALAVTVAAPGLSRAQDAAPPLEENPRAAHFNDVERGWFIGFEAGYLGLLNVRTEDPARFPFAGSSGGNAGGLHIAVQLGKDLSNKLSLALVGEGGNETGRVSYGAFSIYSAGLDVRYAYYSKRDRNDWERFFLYVHGRGAYAVTYPKGLFGTKDFVAAIGPGIEYYTRLRHFSVGASLDYVRAFRAKTSGFALYPTVRYTF